MNASSENFELQQRVLQYLSTAQRPVLQNVSVTVHNETVTLAGTVATFYEKQLAQEIVRRVAGVRQVINLLNVESKNGSLPSGDERCIPPGFFAQEPEYSRYSGSSTHRQSGASLVSVLRQTSTTDC